MENNNVKQLSELEIIAETIEYYKNNPRGIKQNTQSVCVYYDVETENKCAIGRCLIKPEDFKDWYLNIEAIMETLIPEIDNEKLVNEKLNSILKEQYKNHNLHFWKNLQLLHDTPQNWLCNEKGCTLTKHGKENVKQMIIALSISITTEEINTFISKL